MFTTSIFRRFCCSDGLPGSLYNDRDLQALAVAVGDVGLQNRLDLFLAGMDKAAALARARNEALHDKARELQEEREEEDEATDRCVSRPPRGLGLRQGQLVLGASLEEGTRTCCNGCVCMSVHL